MTTYKNYTLANLDNDKLIITRRIPKVPLYVAVYEVIFGLIKNGEIKAGDKIPSENYLAEHLAVARSTVRMAILVLQEDGILYTHHGKGTFVAEIKKATDSKSGPLYFVKDIVEANGKRYDCLDGVFAIIPPEEFLSEKLHVENDDTLAMILKTHRADGEVVAYTQDFFKINDRLADPDMDFYAATRVFEEWVKSTNDKIAMTFSPVFSTADVRKKLEAGSSKALLLVSCELYSGGKPIVFSKRYFNTSRIKYEITLEY